MEGRALPFSDDEYVRKFQETGDNECFAELFVRHRKKVFFACRGFFQEHQKAEDATQETFLRAYRRIQSFQGGDFAGWPMRIARNVCIDELRRNRVEPITSGPLLSETAGSAELEVSFELHQQAEMVLQEMKSLCPEQRRCLELKIEGCSYQETSARTGFSIDAVRSHLQNGRRMLWKRMEQVLADSK